jgi:hypothetical protein
MKTFTKDDLKTLDKAITSGVLSVRVGDETVTYQSLDALLRAREKINSLINAKRGRARTISPGW